MRREEQEQPTNISDSVLSLRTHLLPRRETYPKVIVSLDSRDPILSIEEGRHAVKMATDIVVATNVFELLHDPRCMLSVCVLDLPRR